MIDIIAFDADDTLWENESFYTRAKGRFFELISQYSSAEMVELRLNETEISNIRFYGYGIKSFILSMIETAINLSEGRVQGEEIQQIIDLAKEVLTAEVSLFEHAEETVFKLAEKYDLMLITKGEQWEQERKIRGSGLAKYFRYIEIVGDKTQQAYQLILAKYQIDPARFLMVGNSIKSDILPVLAIGGQAVYIPYENTWFHELETSGATHPPYDELAHLGLLPDYIDRVVNPID